MGETNPNPATEPTSQATTSSKDASVDRWDRRFRIEGDVVEALKVVVSGRSQKKS